MRHKNTTPWYNKINNVLHKRFEYGFSMKISNNDKRLLLKVATLLWLTGFLVNAAIHRDELTNAWRQEDYERIILILIPPEY
jgi:hypothetical protein